MIKKYILAIIAIALAVLVGFFLWVGVIAFLNNIDYIEAINWAVVLLLFKLSALF